MTLDDPHNDLWPRDIAGYDPPVVIKFINRVNELKFYRIYQTWVKLFFSFYWNVLVFIRVLTLAIILITRRQHVSNTRISHFRFTVSQKNIRTSYYRLFIRIIISFRFWKGRVSKWLPVLPAGPWNLTAVYHHFYRSGSRKLRLTPVDYCLTPEGQMAFQTPFRSRTRKKHQNKREI